MTSPMSSHPVVMLWRAAGEPEPNWQGKARTARSAPAQRNGICALTGMRGPVVPIFSCVSDNFTQLDRLSYLHHHDVGLSIPAAWAFRERAAMFKPHGLVNGRWQQLDPSTCFHALLDFEERCVITVPQSRQKHLLPWVSLGTVRTDDETLPWSSDDEARLRVFARLRRLGFSPTAIAEPAPRAMLLARLSQDERREVLSLWHRLDVWRTHRSYIDVAAFATKGVSDGGTNTNH